MIISKERILYLLNAYSNNKILEAEEKELFTWVNEENNYNLLQQHIQKLIEDYDSREPVPAVDWENLYVQILDKSVTQNPSSVIRPIWWLRWSAAAAIVFLLGAGSYLYLNHPVAKNNITTAKTFKQPVKKDVAPPEKNKAVLTLADGRTIQLDSVGKGTLAHQGNVQVVKQADGQITYNGTGSEGLYNILNVPRGSKIVTIRLSDGTQVWLNSESSLRYPASFTGTERKVEITGEAYFEVAHNAAMPFIVKKDAMEIKVLGTHFNIDTYEDEGVSKVTLLEGSIKVSKGDHQNLLRVGQQAQVNDNIRLINGVNIEEVMAWKNGKFQFGEKADLHLILMKIARWYDVEVEYEGAVIPEQFGGEMPMNSNLSQVLEILKTSGVKFTIEGKKVIVKS
ncbi:MAG: FecR domain-containing protein [Ginsengibacter sp.]